MFFFFIDTLKQKLLDTNYFLDNAYLNFYISLICKNLDNVHVKFETQRHHILQVAYYKFLGYDYYNNAEHKALIDQNNIVELKYCDHVLAHMYLAKCTISPLKEANLYAFFRMYKKICAEEFTNISFTESQLAELQACYTQYLNFNSSRTKGTANPNYGKLWSEKQRKEASQRILTLYEKNPEVKDQISQALKDHYLDHEGTTKGKIRCYSPTGESKFCDVCPEG